MAAWVQRTLVCHTMKQGQILLPALQGVTASLAVLHCVHTYTLCGGSCHPQVPDDASRAQAEGHIMCRESVLPSLWAPVGLCLPLSVSHLCPCLSPICRGGGVGGYDLTLT